MQFLKNVIKLMPDTILNSENSRLLDNLSKKERILWDGILNDEITTNQQASKILYDAVPSNVAFQKFKQRFKQKLFYITLGYKSTNENVLRGVYIAILRQYFFLKIIAAIGVSKIIGLLSTKLIHKTFKYQLNEICLDIIRMHLSSWSNKLTKVEIDYYQNLSQQLIEAIQLELNAEIYIARVSLLLSNRISLNTELAALTKDFIKKNKVFVNHVRSYKFHYYFFRLSILHYLATGDYEHALKESTEAFDYFNSLEFKFQGYLRTFSSRIISVKLQLGKNEEVTKHIQERLLVTPKHSQSYLRLQDLLLMLSYRTKDYKEVESLLHEFKSSAYFSVISKGLLNRFRIYEAYSLLLQRIGIIPMQATQNIITRKLKKLAELKTDKKGANITLRIVELLFYSFTKDFFAVDDQIEALEQYLKRHIRSSENIRSKIFIRMLLQLPICNYKVIRFKRNTAKYMKQLEKNPISTSIQAEEIEIIPYEDLWEMIHTKVLDPRRR